MKISNLPADIKALAVTNYESETDPLKSLDKDDLYEAFHFDGTPEGFDFWADVHSAETAEEIEHIKKHYEL